MLTGNIGPYCDRISASCLTVSQVVLDGVCSVASEEIRMDAWGIDIVMTASQKGLGTPPGLSIVVASQRALKVSSRNRAWMTGVTTPGRCLRNAKAQ